MGLSIKEIIVTGVLPLIKAVGIAELTGLLAQLKAHNTEETYVTFLRSEYGNAKLLEALAKKTKTKIDDGLLDIIIETIEAAAEADDIEL